MNRKKTARVRFEARYHADLLHYFRTNSVRDIVRLWWRVRRMPDTRFRQLLSELSYKADNA